jgi:hypothetical protein
MLSIFLVMIMEAGEALTNNLSEEYLIKWRARDNHSGNPRAAPNLIAGSAAAE